MAQPPSLRFSGLISASIVLVTLAWYWPVLDHDFVHFDDTAYVLENPHVHRGLTLSTVGWALTTDRMGTWHPLTWLSHAADWSLYGDDARGHHLTSLLLHALNAVLLFWVLRRMTGSIAPSAFVAFVFALHPLNVATVAWIASRKGLLSTTCWLLTMWAYAAYTERGGVRRYVLVIVVFALGLAAKPMLITLPLVLWLLDVWPLRRMQWNGRAMGAERPVYEKLPMLLLCAVVGMAVVWVRRIGEPMPLDERLARVPVAYVTYLWRVVWPEGLATPYPPSPAPAASAVLGASILLVAISAVALVSRRKRPFFLVGWLWFLVTLAPVIGIVQFGAYPMADRWMYVPMIGVLIAVAWGAGSLAPRSAVAKAALGALATAAVIGFAAATQAQIAIWQNSETLFRHAIAVTENNRTAHYNLAWVLAKTGRRQEAITEYRRALAIDPDDFPSQHNLALLLLEDGLTDEAIEATCAAIRLTEPKDEAIRGRLKERLEGKRCD